MQASGSHFGKAVWIAPSRIDGTRRIRQKQCELRDDGNVHGRRLRKALGERREGLTLLEDHPRPDRNERRCPSATRGERDDCLEPCRDLSSLRQRPESRSANHQLGRTPRIGPLRECSVKLRTPPLGADADQPATRHAPRQKRDPSDGIGTAHGVRNGWKLAAVRRRPVVPGRSGGRPAAPRRRPRADLPTLPQTVRGRAAARSASSPRRADSGCRRRDRAAARRAPRARPTSHTLAPRLEEPRQGPRAHRAAPPGRLHDRCARLPWPRPADRVPQRRLCVLTALPHAAAGRPPCEWGPPSIYGAARTQSGAGANAPPPVAPNLVPCPATGPTPDEPRVVPCAGRPAPPAGARARGANCTIPMKRGVCAEAPTAPARDEHQARRTGLL
jgi:hypothetical protein